MKTRTLIICRVRRRPATTPAGGDMHFVELGSARHTEQLADPDTRTA